MIQNRTISSVLHICHMRLDDPVDVRNSDIHTQPSVPLFFASFQIRKTIFIPYRSSSTSLGAVPVI